VALPHPASHPTQHLLLPAILGHVPPPAALIHFKEFLIADSLLGIEEPKLIQKAGAHISLHLLAIFGALDVEAVRRRGTRQRLIDQLRLVGEEFAFQQVAGGVARAGD
jgi:hypothetical protein